MGDRDLVIGDRVAGRNRPVLFMADIASNHDGQLERAIELIQLAAAGGADVVKFQHFEADRIVSDHGFRALGSQASHQATWEKSVYEVYKDAEVDPGWTEALRTACRDAGIALATTPYSLDLVDRLAPQVAALKIGSGDITWPAIIDRAASKDLPILISTGASDLADVVAAMRVVLARTEDVVLMQCNTNYTGSQENFRYVNLNVLRTYELLFPGVVLGLSDHTPGHAAVLGAVALGARVIEKHFTDDPDRSGPDHGFSMAPVDWREMVLRTRELESALGTAVKEVADNERETVVLQRRSLRAVRDLPQGTVLDGGMLEALRPCPPGGLEPARLPQLMGRSLARRVRAGDCVQWQDLA